VGAPFTMVFQLLTFQGVRYSLFNFDRGGGGGHADFDAIEMHEPNPRGLMRPIPYGERIELVTFGSAKRSLAAAADGVRTVDGAGTPFEVVDRDLGRAALQSAHGFLTAASDGTLSLTDGDPGDAQTFQWIETFTGELTLLSLSTHRYVRVDPASGALAADAPGPHPNGGDGVRWDWRLLPR
jgi:hypothetical protein